VRGCFICGGDALAPQKQQEANSQVALNDQLTSMFKTYASASNPFWLNQLKNGLPFMSQLTDYTGGTLAKSFAPVRAQVNRNLSGFGDTLPSGFKEQTNTNLGAEEGQAFDQNMVQALMANQQAKERAAGALNPLAAASTASGTAGSVLSAPAVNGGGIGNFLGGAVSSLLQGAGAGATAAAI
jgi:hypothetical protein